MLRSCGARVFVTAGESGTKICCKCVELSNYVKVPFIASRWGTSFSYKTAYSNVPACNWLQSKDGAKQVKTLLRNFAVIVWCSIKAFSICVSVHIVSNLIKELKYLANRTSHCLHCHFDHQGYTRSWHKLFAKTCPLCICTLSDTLSRFQQAWHSLSSFGR